jgi:hypothetical protein
MAKKEHVSGVVLMLRLSSTRIFSYNLTCTRREQHIDAVMKVKFY